MWTAGVHANMVACYNSSMHKISMPLYAGATCICMAAAVHTTYKMVCHRSCVTELMCLTGCACSIHVASVVQMTHMILCHGGLMKVGAISPMQQAASLWSALVHDYEHGGLNNDFL